ncbi:MAG: hypothetical protein K2K98_04130 [Muribaculaceae bacterium]|nr:hypothetical protein [Muribaculaceae bacterium]
MDTRTEFEKMKGDYDGAVLSLLRLSDILIEGMSGPERKESITLDLHYAVELISGAQIFCENALNWMNAILDNPSNLLSYLSAEQRNEMRRSLKELFKDD